MKFIAAVLRALLAILQKRHARKVYAGGVMALAGVSVYVGSATVPSGGGGAQVANYWVDTSGGTCTRQPTAGEYVDTAACATPVAAWNAATAGDTIRVKDGSYTSVQNFTSDKASETTIIGESRAGVILDPVGSEVSCSGGGDAGDFSRLCFAGNNMTFENLTIDSNANDGGTSAGRWDGTNVTMRNMAVTGQVPSLSIADPAEGFHWDGGVFGQSDIFVRRWCGDGLPSQVEADDAVIEDVYWYPQGTDGTPYVPPCSQESSNGFHMEYIRVQGADAITVRNNYFANGGEAGSGFIFFSDAASCCNHVIEGNYFGESGDPFTSMQAHANLGTCSNWTFRSNTFMYGFGLDCTESGHVYVGNAGVMSCFTGGSYNVFANGSCSGTGNTTVANYAALNLTSTGRPNAGSPVINAGPPTCATVTPDIDGTTRPQSTACDAGAFERP
jgi:hypothetical protein